MKVLRTVAELRQWRHSLSNDVQVGFVPTMGALHKGHVSLVQQSKLDNDVTVVSIFVNPSQFAPNEDLDSYPRTFQEDMEKLEAYNVDVLFAPGVKEMYPSGIPLDKSRQKGAFVNVIGLSEQLEGQTRPQFFRGVATVVTKLFNVVQPNLAYFGQKDVQQSIVLKQMVKDLLMPLEIRVLPIVREENGLAMSSRNTYLSKEVKDKSKLIYQSLLQGQSLYNKGERSAEKIIKVIKSGLEDPLFQLDYVSIADKEELSELTSITNGAVLSIAVYVEGIRLIDNIIL